MTTQDARRQMVEQQLAARGICDRRVLAAMARIERERFLPEHLAALAYADCAQPIACDQTISQPYIVARMTEALELVGNERVLEVGTGTGYQTAVLADLAAEVVTIERHAELADSAHRRLDELGFDNIVFAVGDGTRGWLALAPYHAVLVAAATAECPPALWSQLAEGGRLVLPLGAPGAQALVQIRKRHGQPVLTTLGQCRFVPLVAGPAAGD